MKKFTLLFIAVLSLAACSSDDSSSGSINNYSDFEQVIYRVRFTKKSDMSSYPWYLNNGIETYPAVRIDFSVVIESDIDAWANNDPIDYHIDSTYDTPATINAIDNISESYVHAVVLANNIPVRTINNEHDFSFFNSLSDVTTIDVDVTGLEFFDVSARGYYETRDFDETEFGSPNSYATISGTLHDVDMISDGFDGNLIEYLEYAFVTYEIQGNKLIIFDDYEL